MTNIQRVILKIGIGLVLLLNLIGAVPRRFLYVAPLRPVGEDVVNVYPARGESYERPVRIIEDFTAKGPVYSGPKVQVYIRSSYKDEQAEWFPRATLVIFLVTSCAVLASKAVKHRA